MNNPLVSVIVPTKNSSEFLEACLQSIKAQTYGAIELLVVDNFSTDSTPEIAKRYTENVYQIGPERSAQRNFGATKATGQYVVFIDSDMQLSPKVIESAVAKVSADPSIKGVIIPEESFGEGFWAQCKKLEKSFYIGVDAVEAARFINRDTFEQIGGYNEQLISGEDWDMSDRVEEIGKIARIDDLIYHNEGRISLMQTLKKKYYYAKQARQYLKESKATSGSDKRKSGVIGRYALFFSHPVKLFANPSVGLGMLFMKTSEFGAGALGMIATV
jgi:glycosyltransferase involved in cell wall biosynthesis